MKKHRTRLPSPAMVVATFAIALAAVGTAIAEPGAISDKITKSKVKSIARKQIQKAAPGLSVDNAGRLGGVDASGYIKGPLEPVHRVGAAGEPGFGPNWSNVAPEFESAGFYKDPFGIVHLVGDLAHAGVGNGQTVFTLPDGYRPAKQQLFAVQGNGDSQTATLRLDPSGEVRMFGVNVSSSAYSLNGVTFRPG